MGFIHNNSQSSDRPACGAAGQHTNHFQTDTFRKLSSSSYSELYLTGASQELDRAVSSSASIQHGNPLRWANYYPTEGSVVVGGSYANYPTHQKVHDGLMSWQRGQGKAISQADLRNLEENRVDGFLDGINYIVRIEDHRELFKAYSHAKGDERDYLKGQIDRVLDRYRTAIDIASKAAHERGGKVVLQAEEDPKGETSYPILICKMLGRLHEASAQTTMLADALIRKSVQKTDAGECFYSKTTATRYFFPEQYLALLGHLPDQDKFLNSLRTLDELLHSRNTKGQRNAQFFVVDPISKQLVESEKGLAIWNDAVRDLRQTSELYRGRWQDGMKRIGDALREIAAMHRKATNPAFANINLGDSEFIEGLADVLRHGVTDLALGSGISTPLIAVENGYFSSKPGHEFIHTGAVAIHEHITNWVLQRFPESQEADYLVLCETLIPLTFDLHPSQTVKDFGDLPQKSYVILFGKIGEEERRIVIRENIWAPHRWRERSTDTVTNLLQKYSPEDLSQWAQNFRKFQYCLSHELVLATGARQISVADAFEPASVVPGLVDDMEFREFVNGSRADLQSTVKWSFEKFKAAMTCLGEVFAVGFVEQIPDLSLSDIVFSEFSPNGVPEGFTLLSATETFCHSLGIRSVDKYMRTIPNLYGNHLTRWIEAYCSAGMGASLDGKLRDEQREELIETCLAATRAGLLNLVRGGGNDFCKGVDAVRQHYDLSEDSGVVPPPELDMRRALGLSRQLARISNEQIDLFVGNIKNTTLVRSGRLEQMIAQGARSPDIKLSPIQIDEFLTAACSLIGNHFSDDKRFPLIDQVYNGTKVDLSPYTLKEITWYLTLLDVGARLSKLGGDDRRLALLEAAAFAGSFDDFYIKAQHPSVGLNLPKRSLEIFFNSFEGMINLLRNLDGNDPPQRLKKVKIKQDLKLAFALRGAINN